MGRPYKIRDGCAFVLDGHRMTGGERIVLEDDVAQAHAEKLDPIDVEAEAAERAGDGQAEQAKAPKPAKTGDAAA